MPLSFAKYSSQKTTDVLGKDTNGFLRLTILEIRVNICLIILGNT